jgi:catechol 2,3-dioxygenase-like lactoylglutathione lyase family enzyme
MSDPEVSVESGREITMKVSHLGLACRSEESAERFYEKFLGMKKLDRKTVPASLAGAFFGIPSDLAVLNYVRDDVYFEVFLHEGERPAAGYPAHVCLEVGDLEAFLERARAMEVSVVRAPKGDRWITFIRDFDGNLFEIKGTA